MRIHDSKFKLGETVNFIRVTPEGLPQQGEGIVWGNVIALNHRPNVQVKEGDRIYNLEEGAINQGEAGQAAYIEHVEKLRACAEEHNSRSQGVIDQGNRMVNQMNSEFFGPSLNEDEIA